MIEYKFEVERKKSKKGQFNFEIKSGLPSLSVKRFCLEVLHREWDTFTFKQITDNNKGKEFLDAKNDEVFEFKGVDY